MADQGYSSGEHRVGEKIYVGFRLENISILPREKAGENLFRVRIRDSIFMGPYTRYIADLCDREMYIKIPPTRILLMRG